MFNKGISVAGTVWVTTIKSILQITLKSQYLFSGEQFMSRIAFRKTHALIKKWAAPEVFGTGTLAKAIRQSKYADKITKSPLPCLNPYFTFFYRTKFEESPNLGHERIFVDCPDGGVIGIDKMAGSTQSGNSGGKEKPIILMCPGGNENTVATKIQTLCKKYLDSGYDDVFVCNFRGNYNSPFKTPQFSMCHDRFNELHFAVDHINNMYRDREILLAGDCFGGMFVVDYLTTTYRPVPDNVIGGVVHSVQWNSVETRKIQFQEPQYSLFLKPMAKYQTTLLTKGKKGSETLKDMVKERIGAKNFSLISKLSFEDPSEYRQLYKLALGPLYGMWNVGSMQSYDEVEDIFNRATSPHYKLQANKLSRPLVVINAYDDMTGPMGENDIAEMERDPNMCLWLFATGGHCGYIKHMFPQVSNFIDEVMVDCSDIVAREASSSRESVAQC